MEDRYAYERALLRYMLTARTAAGAPVVVADTLLRELADDVSAHSSVFRDTPSDIAAAAMATGPDNGFGGEPLLLCFNVELRYRVMVTAHHWPYHPDWLRVAPSPALGSPRFPAWDQRGRKVC
jgi:hypothetical protein